MSASPPPASSPTRTTSSLTWLMDRVGNVWFGVTLLILIFIYSSIGSAVPLIRQGALADWTGFEFLRFEKSEMEWFSWWPFTLLIGLFCLALILVTVRRIPLTRLNAGVWAIHTGIVMTCVFCTIYFATKVEGDVAVFESRARITVPGLDEPVLMVVRPEASSHVVAGERHYHISVAHMQPGYEILTGEHQGRRTQAIWFNIIQSEEPRSFTRLMLVGYPQYTEDIVSGHDGHQRAIQATGQRLVDTDLEIALEYDPVTHFYHADQPPVRSTGAIYARFSPQDEWTQVRFRNLPHYYERLTHRGEVWPVPGERLPPPRVLDLLPVDRIDGNVPESLDFRVTDYLPYADLQTRWLNTGTTLNPMIRFRLASSEGSQSYDMFAFDPSHSRMHLPEIHFLVEFLWAASHEEREELVRRPDPRLVVRIPGQEVEQTFQMQALMEAGGLPVEGTDYSIAVERLLPAGHDRPASAELNVTRAEESFTLIVEAGGQTVDTPLQHDEASGVESGLEIEYLDPAPQRLLFVGGPDQHTVEVVFSRMDGMFHHLQAEVGRPFSLFGSQSPMVIEALHATAAREVRPVIVPRRQRQSLQAVGKAASVIRLEVSDGRMVQSLWLPFNRFAFDDDQRAQPNRFSYAPRRIRLADGRTLELLYSRWRDPLPSPVALDRFVLQTYPGGERPSDYVSLVRFWEEGRWSPLLQVRSNNPAQHGPLWYFQSQWDPGTEAHTVLGVGNRNGVHGMMASVCLSIAGMIFAFYVKPSMIRRRKQAALAAAAARDAAAPVKRPVQRLEPGEPEETEQPEVSHV